MDESLAYPVPFTVERCAGNVYRLNNTSTETVHGVAFTLHGAGVMGASAPATLTPGDALEVVVAGRNLARSAILVVRWFRPNDLEYLWRISF